jgi:hypothetical protein
MAFSLHTSLRPAGAFHVELKYSRADRYRKEANGETLGQPLLIEGTGRRFAMCAP